MTARAASRTGSGAVTGDVVRRSMFGTLLIVGGGTLITVTCAWWFSPAAACLARDVGNNCNLWCYLGALGALAGAVAGAAGAAARWVRDGSRQPPPYEAADPAMTDETMYEIVGETPGDGGGGSGWNMDV